MTVSVREESVWFGPADRPLYGRLTVPVDSRIRGAVVLVPSIGREVHASRYALRRLAEMLGAEGFLTLRMDYNGTGDSAGSTEEENLDVLWRDNVSSAVELLRHSGTKDLTVVGVRLGATVAGVAAVQNDLRLSSLILWDPCESGRSFLREVAALEALHKHDQRVNDGEPYATSEFVLSDERAEELKRLNLSKSGSGKFAERVLVITRIGREPSESLKSRLSDENVEWSQTDEQEAMLEVSPLRSVTASRSLHSMTTWLAGAPATWTQMSPLPTRARETFREGGGPYEVVERPIALGDAQLFGLVSEPNGPIRGPLIVMLNVANEDHTGPSRLWVELARRWSSHGLRCIRFDVRGVGESPWLDRGKSFVYENEWLADATAVAPFLSPYDPSDAVYIGLSSGVYLAVESAIKLGARGLCVINPPIAMDSVQLIVRLRSSASRALRSLGDRLLWAMLYRPWVYAGLWHVVRLALPRAVSKDLLATAVDDGTEVLVLASAEDVSPAPQVPFLRSIDRRRIQRPKNYEAVFVPGLDHSMHAVEGRSRVIELMDRFVLERMSKGDQPPDQ